VLEAFHRQLEEPGDEEGEEVGAEQGQPPKKITLPAFLQVAVEPGQFADGTPRELDMCAEVSTDMRRMERFFSFNRFPAPCQRVPTWYVIIVIVSGKEAM
jgi:hypothetical protein